MQPLGEAHGQLNTPGNPVARQRGSRGASRTELAIKREENNKE